MMDHQVGALGNDLQIVVCHERGDLKNRVDVRFQTGHLEIHPCQHGAEPMASNSCIRFDQTEYGARVAAVLEIPLLRLVEDLPLPAYARVGDAGADLVAAEDVILKPGGGRALVPTGAAIAIPFGYAGFVQPRSGLALKHGVTCLNTPGLIDSGYRGELKVLLVNTDPVEPFEVLRGERIAQLVVQRVEEGRFVQVEELPMSERGDGGFGSTGR